MAYRIFDDIDGGAGAPYNALHATVSTQEHEPGEALTVLEWSVVRLARNDSRRSLMAPGWLSAVTRLLTNEPDRRLANPRLEALRRLAVLVWHDGLNVPAHERDAFLDAGFTAGQMARLADHIVAARARDCGTVALL